MAKSIVYFCDVCGVQKKQSNHWWDVFIQVEDGYNPSDESKAHLEIHPMNETAEDEHLVACGHACVIKLVSQFMQTGELKPLAEATR